MTTAWVAPLTVMVATTGPPPAATDIVSNALVALGSVLSCAATIPTAIRTAPVATAMTAMTANILLYNVFLLSSWCTWTPFLADLITEDELD